MKKVVVRSCLQKHARGFVELFPNWGVDVQTRQDVRGSFIAILASQQAKPTEHNTHHALHLVLRFMQLLGFLLKEK